MKFRFYFEGTAIVLGKPHAFKIGSKPGFAVVGIPGLQIPVTILSLTFGLAGDLQIGFGDPEPEKK